MKLRRLASFVAVLVLFFSLAPSASAVTLQTNLAGRPIWSDTIQWCTGVAYGRVNGYMVLFTAAHCRDHGSGYDYQWGDPVPSSTGAILGFWEETAASSKYDLAWIRLTSGSWPTVPYQIYRGDCTDGTCPGGNTSSYWQVDNLYGSNDYSCANAPLHNGASAWENWRVDQNDHYRARHGHFSYMGPVTPSGSWATPCMLQSDLYYSTTYKHSGAGLVADTGEVIGVATGIDSNGQLRFSNFREAILHTSGAHLCVSSMGNDCL